MLSEHVKCSRRVCQSPESLVKHLSGDASSILVLFITVLRNSVGAGGTSQARPL